MNFVVRKFNQQAADNLIKQGVHPLLAQLYAARNVRDASELDTQLKGLVEPRLLLGGAEAGQLIAQAILQQQKICIIADYDCDGATGCAVAVSGLQLLGANKVTYIVPNRMTDGYGLTPELVLRAQQLGAELLITVDNGMASITGVETAKRLGMAVIITDHHLPAQANGRVVLPAADAIVNPNQPSCQFPSKSLAGVGVMFYVLLLVRKHLRQAGVFTAQSQPNLASLLPLVALGTIADVVKLDQNNRTLVAQGLERIRHGDMPAGMKQLFAVSGRSFRQATTDDLGFALAPRINAAGRLDDMSIGVSCLTSQDASLATKYAKQLDDINLQRRQLEDGMRRTANTIIDKLVTSGQLPQQPTSLSLYSDRFHEGVIGIVASRLKDKFNCPIFIFARSQDSQQQDILKGSGRSIYGMHLKDVLDLMHLRRPELLLKFGGHALAAGCSIRLSDFGLFQNEFTRIIAEQTDAPINQVIETDGALAADFLTLECATLLKQQIWGQGFATPVFNQRVEIVSQRLVGSKQQHSSLKLNLHDQQVDAIWFGQSQSLPQQVNLAFVLDINQWRGQTSLSLRIIDGQI